MKAPLKLLSIFMFLAPNVFAGAPQVLPDRAERVGVESLHLNDQNIKNLRGSLALYGVQVAADQRSKLFFDADLLYFLNDFFIMAKPGRTVILRAADSEGPRLVWSEDHGQQLMITFARNAKDSLFVKSVRAEAERLGINLSEQSARLSINYSNELMKQLFATLDFRTKVQMIEAQFKVKVRPAELKSGQFIEFFDSELDYIFNVLADIPVHVRQAMRLRSLFRKPTGLTEGTANKPTAASYSRSEERIQFYDLAFAQKAAFGEDTISHELCHAISAGLAPSVQREFYSISFSQGLFGGDQWSARYFTKDFVSDYALTDPEEDFAESCSHFVSRSAVLHEKAPAKEKFLLEKVFGGISFENQTQSRLSVFMKSLVPEDKTPPWLSEDISTALKLVAKTGPDSTVYLSISLRGVRDDLSGVQSVYVNFDNDFTMYPKEEPSGEFTSSDRISMNIAPKEFTIQSLRLEDRAGNVAHIAVNKKIRIDANILAQIAAATSSEMKPNLSLDMRKIQILPRPEISAGTAAYVELPLPHPESLDVIVLEFQLAGEKDFLGFRTKGGGETIAFQMNNGLSSSSENLISRPGQNIKFAVFISGAYPAGRYELTAVRIYINRAAIGRPSSTTWKYDFHAPWLGAENLVLQHNSAGAAIKKPQINANESKISGKSKVDGGGEIELEVPVTGSVPGGTLKGSVQVTGPDGKTYFGSATQDSSSGSLSVKVPLPPNFRSGKYSVESMTVQEFPSMPKGVGQAPRENDNSFGQTKELFRERKIKREVDINPDPKAF